MGDAAALYSQTGVDISPTPELKDKGGELKAIVDEAFLRLEFDLFVCSEVIRS